MWLLATISIAILALSGSVVILTWTAKTFGSPEDTLADYQHPVKKDGNLPPKV
ncbi:hypothetical protein [Psychrobacter ciconiae]|uniref:hypothetical protein n=1 Tax=Psychrobacter ciconiae TaxID=1553449 RepID=UPI001D1274AC|nr:hypothetical protein [Psychrobacter ciconiae]